MKFLVLGSIGMAGHTITLYLKEQGHDVTAFSIKPFPYCENVIGDAMDAEFIKSMLKNVGADVVINCVGMLNQSCDREPSQAVYLNSYFPHFVADALRETESRFIHMSTDCVFSGDKGSYSECSFRDGKSFYDRTKALGEIDDDRNLTFRNSIIGPDMNENGIGLFNWFMKQNGPVKGYTGAIWTGVTTLVLARAMEAASTEKLTGIYNLVNNETISKYDLINLFNKHMRNGALPVYPDATVNIDKSLICNRTDFSFVVPGYEQMVIEMNQWIIDHKDLYLHYNLGGMYR
ncbi:MAG: SDR family oxidoreductase [Armatimonadota bacterium]